VTRTATGYPATLAEVQAGFGQSARCTVDEGWFWVFATPGSAKRMRRDGQKAVGTEFTTWFPPQTRGFEIVGEEPEGDHRPMYDEDDNIIGIAPKLIPVGA
jgi:hypothetical protein